MGRWNKVKLPHKTLERKLFAGGYKYVIGVDEVGMACLAGPVYVCAVMFAEGFFKKSHKNLEGLRDSKQLLPHQRERFYRELLREKDIKFQLASCRPVTIDRINIYQAARKAMRRAIRKLELRSKPSSRAQAEGNQESRSKNFKNLNSKFLIHNSKTIVLVDGPNKITGLNLPQIPIVRGDRKVFSIACASIIAKVTRDRIMTRLAKQYPQYGLEKHKGYPTKLHQAMLTQYGPSEIHRKSFRLDYV